MQKSERLRIMDEEYERELFSRFDKGESKIKIMNEMKIPYTLLVAYRIAYEKRKIRDEVRI